MTTDIDILGGMDLGCFTRDWLEKKYLLINNSLSEAQIGHIMPRQSLDDLLNRRPLESTVYQVIKNGTVDTSPKMHPYGGLDPHYLLEEFARGATLRFTDVDRLLPNIQEMCKWISSRFMCVIFANVYATPASSSGFNPHYDDHDVFILQCYGKKLWSIYDCYANKVVLPLEGFRFDATTNAPGPVAATFPLLPGDVLYIPRGQMHSASTVQDGWESESIHITLGVRWVSVNEAFMDVLSKRILSDVAFRQSLVKLGAEPESCGRINPGGCLQKLVDLAVSAFSNDAIEESVRSLLGRWQHLYYSRESIRVFSEADSTAIND